MTTATLNQHRSTIFYQILPCFIKCFRRSGALLAGVFGLLGVLLFSVVGPVPAQAGPASSKVVAVPQGGVGRVEVTIAPGDSAPWASFDGELVTFRKVSPGRFMALVGVDMETGEGNHPLEVKVLRGGESVVVARPLVKVVPGGFGVQYLTLPDKMVTLDDATLTRVKKEKGEVRTLWRDGAKIPIWDSLWQMPVSGKPSGSFGKRRVINGQPRSPHNGEDIPAAKGTPVLAPNTGIVRLAKDRFFGGNTVFLEHGGGLFTFYMHLSEIDVVDGQQVTAGEMIGRVGASGRATGPHLHWGGRLNNARINPMTLVKKSPVLSISADIPRKAVVGQTGAP